jgi:hypothetical protein
MQEGMNEARWNMGLYYGIDVMRHQGLSLFYHNHAPATGSCSATSPWLLLQCRALNYWLVYVLFNGGAHAL